MVKYGRCLLLVILLVTECLGAEHGLEEDVDQIIRAELGDDPFTRRLTPNDYKTMFDRLNITNTKQNNTYNINNNTKQNNTYNINNYTNEKDFNGTEILLRARVREMERIINLTTNRLEEFKNNVDVLDELFQKARKHEPLVNGRRASDSNNQLLESMLLDAESAMKQIGIPSPPAPDHQKTDLQRAGFPHSIQTYMYYLPYEVHQRMKKKTVNMMYTHLYRTQYYVTFSQQMRKRYLHHVRYKLGFCFALLRQLYQEQRSLLNGLDFYWNNFIHYQGLILSWNLFTFEKVQKLQRDIRDVIHHIKNLEYERKMTETPDYYKFFSSSTGRYSG